MPAEVESQEAQELKERIDKQGSLVRSLKSEGDKGKVDEAVQLLLRLKSDYKALTGVDLAGGGSSKKNKKEKKAVQVKENLAETEKPCKVSKVVKTNSVPELDMSMKAVSSRLAQRAAEAESIISYLKTHLVSVRQSSALAACKKEEERLQKENELLQQEVAQLKNRLTQAEIKNGIKQVPLPAKGSAKSEPTVRQPQPGAAAAPVNNQPKKEKVKKEPKAAKQQKGGGSEGATVDISRIAMRVGQIVGVKRHPDADALYVEDVNLGEEKHRTILSGLVKHVPLEQMQDRLAIFMTNLKPAKMRGIMSEGMIMCGSTPEKVEIIEVPHGAKVGDEVYVEGYQGTPDAQLNPKKKIFEQVQPDLEIDQQGRATYKGVPWKVKDVEGFCTVPTMKGTPIK